MNNHDGMIQFPSLPESPTSDITSSDVADVGLLFTLGHATDPKHRELDVDTLFKVQNVIESVNPRSLAWQTLYEMLYPGNMIPRTRLIETLNQIFLHVIEPLEDVMEACKEGYVFPSSYDTRKFLIGLPAILLNSCGARTPAELQSMVLATNPLGIVHNRDSDVLELSQTTMENVLDIASAALSVSAASVDHYWNMMKPWVRILLDEPFMKPQVDMFHKVNDILEGEDSEAADEESESIGTPTTRTMSPSAQVNDWGYREQLQENVDPGIQPDADVLYDDMVESPMPSVQVDDWPHCEQLREIVDTRIPLGAGVLYNERLGNLTPPAEVDSQWNFVQFERDQSVVFEGFY